MQTQMEIATTKSRQPVLSNGEACLFCNGHTEPWFVKENGDGCFPLVKCLDCGSAYVWPRPSGEEIDRIYLSKDEIPAMWNDQVAPTVEDSQRSQHRYYPDVWADARMLISECRRLARGYRFLDVGTGTGEFSLLARDWGFDVAACEPNVRARAIFAQLNGFEPDPCVFDSKFAERHAGEFDVVFLSQTLEHAHNPGAMVRDIYNVLRPGGLAMVASPHFGSVLSRLQGQGDMFISPPIHLNFFSRKGLCRLLCDNDLEPERVFTSCKVNKHTFIPWVRFAWISSALAYGIYGVLRLTDMFGRGMVINTFSRKSL